MAKPSGTFNFSLLLATCLVAVFLSFQSAADAGFSRIFAANPAAASIDLLVECSTSAPCSVEFSASQFFPPSASFFQYSPASRFHLVTLALPEIPASGFLYFRFAGDSSAPFSVRLPDSPTPPALPVGPFSALVSTLDGSPPQVAYVLARIRDGALTGSWSLTVLQDGATHANNCCSGLPTVFGDLTPGQNYLHGPALHSEPGMLLEVLVLSEGRSEAAFTATVLDPAAGTTEPSAQEILLGLGAPEISGDRSSTSGSYTVRWTDVPEASGYELVTFDSAGTQLGSGIQLGAGTATYAFSSVAAGIWFHSVRALRSPEVPGPWSSLHSVQVIPLPESAPVVSSPQFLDTDRPLISWSAVPSPAGTSYWYEVQWGTNPDELAANSRITDSPQAAISVAGPGTYFLRVRALMPGSADAGPWSEVFEFTVGLGVPSLTVTSQTESPRIRI